MKKPFLKSLFLWIFISANLISNLHALELEIQPTIPDRLTFGQLSQYDISGSGGGGVIFLLHLRNPEQEAHPNLKIEFSIKYASSEQGGGYVDIQDGETDVFSLSSSELLISMTSTDFFLKNNPAVKFSNNGTGSSINEDYRDELITRSLESGSLIPGRVLFDFTLKEGDRILAYSKTEHEFLITNVLQPITPGAPISDNLGFISYTPFPSFQWTSDLFNYIYKGYSDPVVFKLSLYESIEGLPASAALVQPIFETETEVNYYNYSSADRDLESGKTYFWKVEGFLRGVAVATMKSDVYEFTYVEPSAEVNPKLQTIFALLNLLLNRPPYDAYAEALRPYSADLMAKLSSEEIDLDIVIIQLQKIISGEYSLENIQLQ